MKKSAYFAIAALALAGCAKEVEAPELQEGTPIVIRAYAAPETKTAYENEKTFSWLEGDNVSLMVVNDETGVPDVIRLTAKSSGPSTELEGTMVAGYSPADYAFYPKDTGDQYYSCDLGKVVDEENKVMNLRLWGTITPDLSNPMAAIPMIGKRDAEGNYAFKTATGIIKLTIENIPGDTYFVCLNHTESVALNGNFSFGEDCTIYMENVVGTAWPQKYVYFTPEADGETRSFYLPIPVGTIPAGLTVSVVSKERGTIELVTTTQPIEIVRNRIVNTPTLKVPDPPVAEWNSLGEGQFIDTYVWAENGFDMEPVEVEFFQNVTEPAKFKMANPYAAAAIAAGLTPEGADEEFFFELIDKGRVQYSRVEMGLSISVDPEKTWAMIDGQKEAGYGNDYSHVVAMDASSMPLQLQLAPCYRTSDDASETGKDHQNGVIEIVFPGAPMLEQFVIPGSNITVSANHVTDGTGAAGLIDNNLATYWHTPWSTAYPSNPDATYGQYVDVILPEYATTVAFNYCTRNTASQNGSPIVVVVGGSADGKTFTEIGTFELDRMAEVTASTWVGLPTFDATGYAVLRFGIAKNKAGYDLRDITDPGSQWCNMAELMVWGIGTGEEVEIEILPDWLEENQVWVKEDMITAANSITWDGGGVPALVDGSPATYWHSDYYYAVTGNDPVYGLFFDIALKNALKDFHFEYLVRATSAGAKPTSILVGVSNDGATWTKVGEYATDEMLNAVAGARVVLPVVNADGPYQYVRFGIADSNNTDEGSLTGDLNWVGWKKCVNLAELMLFTD